MTREDLKNYKYTKKWIKDRIEQLEEYKSTIYNITQILTDMPKGSGQINDKFAEKIAILNENIDSLLEQMIKQQEKQKQILEQLDKVEQPYRLILDKVYVQGKSLVIVACEMNYTYEYTKKMNSIALDKFENVA